MRQSNGQNGKEKCLLACYLLACCLLARFKGRGARIPNGLGSLLEKQNFDQFLPIYGPKTAHFEGILGFSMGQKTRHHGLKTSQNHLFEHPEWPRITFGKTHF